MKRKSSDRPRVAIVGAGFSGTLTAVHLASQSAQVVLIDRTGTFAQGLAYGTRDPAHRLNVCASGMSAFADDLDHFARWLMGRGEGTGASFASRTVYRAYLRDVLGTADDAITLRIDDVVALDDGIVRFASGAILEVDAVVLAAGNLPPQRFRALAALTAPYADDPWSEDGQRVLDDLARKHGDVLLIGTGLTAVDTVLGLDARGFDGRIVAVSRRGLLPRPHAQTASIAIMPPGLQSPLALLRWARAQARVHPWRDVVDSLRPMTQAVWSSWSHAERGRFLRHLRPWWDVHRHRIAPDVSERLGALMVEGRLLVRAGRIADVDGADVTIRARGTASGERIAISGAVNCTGPAGDLRRTDDVLLRSLLARGQATADLFGLGLNIDGALRVATTLSQPIYAIGPMTRGALWEAVAVPEIRVQAEALGSAIMQDLAPVRRMVTS